MRVHILAASAALAVATAAGASQTFSQNPVPATLVHEIRNFEMILVNAVDLGGQQLQAKAANFFPGVVLAPNNDPLVQGARLETGDVVFFVQVPTIDRVALMIINRMSQKGGVPVATVPPDTKVSANTTVPGDPMKVPAAPFNPNYDYSVFVKELLVNAMLENSSPLALKDSESLVLIVSGSNVVVNRLAIQQYTKLILTIKGEDLTQYHQKKLSKVDAKQKIVENGS